MSGSFDPQKHDLGLVRTDGSKVGLMIVRDKGIPQYFVDDDTYLATQYMTASPSYGDLPPEKEFQIGFADD